MRRSAVRSRSAPPGTWPCSKAGRVRKIASRCHVRPNAARAARTAPAASGAAPKAARPLERLKISPGISSMCQETPAVIVQPAKSYGGLGAAPLSLHTLLPSTGRPNFRRTSPCPATPVQPAWHAPAGHFGGLTTFAALTCQSLLASPYQRDRTPMNLRSINSRCKQLAANTKSRSAGGPPGG